MSPAFCRALLCVALMIAASFGPLTLPRACCGDEQLDQGRAIYQKRCASCHGKAGEGVAEHYEEPLVGTATVDELAELIAETMPEDDPEACVGTDAAAVAAYIHGAFYNRAEGPRLRLARLTGVQLRQSLADLYAHFAGATELNEKHGLRGDYYDGSRSRRGSRKLQRIDATIDFDFGDQPPVEGVNAEDYSIQWTGGLKVDVTGSYELIVRSTCAFVFYLGDDDREWINNHVQSGDKTEFRRSIVLTAGRVLPLRIRFYQRKRKTEQPPGRVSLSWIPPHGTEQVVPERNLLAGDFPAVFSLQAKLPPDDRSYGYERASPSTGNGTTRPPTRRSNSARPPRRNSGRAFDAAAVVTATRAANCFANSWRRPLRPPSAGRSTIRSASCTSMIKSTRRRTTLRRFAARC